MNGIIDGDAEDLTNSEWHELLASERRRELLDVLADRTTPVELEKVAVLTVVEGDDPDAGAPDDGSVQRVATTLHHTHLPKMAEAGVLDYDPQSRRIDPRGDLVDSIRDRRPGQ